MKVQLFDQFVDIKKLTLGAVVFLVDQEDNTDTWLPGHITGFPNNSAMKNVGIMVNGIFTHYADIAWDNEN